jgi:cyclic pyranopterin phosphate synthase
MMKGVNDDEVLDLLHFAMERELDISFIEEMPLGYIQSHDRALSSVSNDDIQSKIEVQHRIQELKVDTSKPNNAGPARKFSIEGSRTVLGLISPHTHNFCSSCNRVRLTAEGKLLLCLGNEHSVDFKALLRNPNLNDQELADAFCDALHIKPERHEFDLSSPPQIVRFMNMTGG